MRVWTDPGACKSTMVRALHAWWTANAGPSGIPDRGSFDLGEHRHLLANLLVADVEPDPFRIRYRLVGTRIVSNVGIEFTGRYLDDLIGTDFKIPWIEYYRTAYADRRPLMGSMTEPTAAGSTFTYEFGLFPVAVGTPEVKQFIAVEDYFDFTLRSGALAGL